MTKVRSLALIIPAAGSGERLGKKIPKPYLTIGGKTILEHTLRKFAPLSELHEIVIPTSADYQDLTGRILRELFPDKVTRVVRGGAERQDSIRNALNTLSDDVTLVSVHDAVRPFIDTAMIRACIEEADSKGGAIIAVPAKDTIKVSDSSGRIRSTPDRNTLWQAQTPQIFKASVLKKAYEAALEENVLGTDDASLVERIGEPVYLIEGSRENFKITYPLDLRLAEWLLDSGTGN
ncbi:MAG: 2-C-methyl-D-erythritol 4-phosphate cytidylyltransferase [Balneolaceae bacterium]|nr:2-C-methyl-D-erythritol 4-phosphate cytidylyltransferase [Balneolaceae bacterium]